MNINEFLLKHWNETPHDIQIELLNSQLQFSFNAVAKYYEEVGFDEDDFDSVFDAVELFIENATTQSLKM